MAPIADGQREHHMVIGQRQKLGLAVGEPLARRGPLTLRAVPVAAGVVADDGVAAVFASRNMAAKLRRAAGFDGGHRFQLAEAYMPGVGLAPGGPVAAEDVRNLKRGTRHGPRRLKPWDRPLFFSIRESRSKGLITLRIVLVATRV